MTMNNQHPDFENYDIPEHVQQRMLCSESGYLGDGMTVAFNQPPEVREEIFRWYLDKHRLYGGPYPNLNILGPQT